MCTAEEKFFTPLSASEYRLLDIICLMSDKGMAEVSMEDLARYAQCSEESIRRALRGLEAANLIATTRTKRNLGKLHKNIYQLVSPSHKNVDNTPVVHKIVDEVVHKNVGSTASSNSSNDLVLNRDKTTSYLFGADAPKGRKRKVKVLKVNRWQDDDSNLGGFGLFDSEIQERSTPKVKKNDPSTRKHRPQSEWTAWDVAVEFETRIRGIIPVMSGRVFSVKELAGALAKQRKISGSNALVELELMKMFFEDPWVKTTGKESPGFIMGRYLKSFSIHFNQAMRNLGMVGNQTAADLSDVFEPMEDFVYASDGTQFDNSMPGRRELADYEAELRRTNGV